LYMDRVVWNKRFDFPRNIKQGALAIAQKPRVARSSHWRCSYLLYFDQWSLYVAYISI